MLDLCRLIFGIASDLLRSRVALEAEILVLRQQINVLRRANPKRLRFVSIDRWILGGVTLRDRWPPLEFKFDSLRPPCSKCGSPRNREASDKWADKGAVSAPPLWWFLRDRRLAAGSHLVPSIPMFRSVRD